MYCKKCGNYIPDGIDRCAMCGWIKGTEVVEDKPEEVVEPKKDPLDKFRILLNVITFLVIVLMAVSFITIDYISANKHENMIDAMIYMSEGKKVTAFKVTSNVGKYFEGNASSLTAILAVKILFFYLGIVACMFSLLFLIKMFLDSLNKDNKKNIISLTPAAIIALASFSCGFISTQPKIFYFSLLYSFLICIILILDLILTYKKYLVKDKVLIASILSVIFGLIAFIMLQTNFLRLNSENIRINDYAYLSLMVDKSLDKNTLGVALSVILNFATFFICVVSKQLLSIRSDSKAKASGFVGIAVIVILTIFVFVSLKLYNKEIKDLGGYEVKIHLRYYIALVCGIISQILAIAAYAINRMEYNKTKVYNL